MALNTVSVEWKDVSVEKFFKTLTKNVGQISKADARFVDLLSTAVMRDIDKHFKKEEGPNGAWPKWSISYASVVAGDMTFRVVNNRIVPFEEPDEERSRDSFGKMLQDTGFLRQNVNPNNWRRVSGGIEWYNPAKTRSGFAYAEAHDEGRSWNKFGTSFNLPQRKFMWLSDDALKNMSKITLGKILEGIE